ncbi:MAG: F0F1 ATP synthase subunit gamma [Actinobacteria bacterium]|nr:F0F1 ATP synthase subunit gamma [Actinomycetota bacterium]
MAEQLRVVKRRIGSVQSTQKITRAMELISSSRIIKAQQRVDAARPYAETMRRLLVSVAQNAGNLEHPLLAEREDISTVGHIVVSSDRGLAGAYNSNVLRTTERDIAAHGKEARLFLTGKKAVSYFRFRGYDTSDSWTGVSDRPSIDDARAVAQAAAEAFSKGEVDQVRLTYTKFESAMRQSVVVNQVLPLPREELDEDEDEGRRAGYEFEPAPEEILNYLLPRYLEGTVYQALLEASASEHAARRRAMKAATDNAEELLGDLTRDYNQARQAEITTEIMEVVGGAEALMGASSGEGEGT